MKDNTTMITMTHTTTLRVGVVQVVISVVENLSMRK